MKKLLYLLIFAPLAILAQPKLEWAHNYHPDHPTDLFPSSIEIETDDTAFVYYAGNYVGGTDYDPTGGVDYRENAGSGDMYLQKIKKDNGEVVWTRTWGSSGPEYLQEITLDPFGNIFITGIYRDALDLDPGIGVDLHNAKGFDDLFLLKLDTDGNYLWGHSFKSGNIEQPGAIASDNEGNIYFGATYGANLTMNDDSEVFAFYNADFQSDDSFISKFSKSGELQWVKTYVKPGGFANKLREVLIDNVGDLVVIGIGDESTDYDFGPDEVIIPGDPIYVYLHRIKTTDASLIKVETIPWRNILDVHVDKENNFYFTGRIHFSDTVDMDPGPGEVIQDLYDGTEMLLKYNSDWEYQWINQVRTAGGAVGSVDVDSLGNVYTTLYITSDYIFHKENNTLTLNNERNGFPTAVIVKYNKDGDLMWFEDWDAPGAYAWDITLDKQDNIYIAGDYHESIDLDLDTGMHIVDCAPARLGQYVARYRNCTPVLGPQIDLYTCSPDSIAYPSGKGYIKSPGIYQDTLLTSRGCDSIISIRAFFTAYITEEYITSCEPYELPNGHVAERDTFVQIVYTSQLGCDSAARFYVDITDRLPLKKEKVTACDSLELPNGNMVYQSQNYNYEVEGPNACPQEIELNINIKYSSFSNQAAVFCDSYVAPDGSELTVPGNYEYHFINAAACDSTVYLSLAQESLNLNLINHGDSLSAEQDLASYQWIDCADNSSIPSATMQGYKPKESGSYKVAISFLDCQDTSRCEQITVAGIEDLESLEVEVYPNPFRGKIVINRLNTTDELSYELLDVSGKILRTGSITQGQNTLTTERLAQGTYFLRIINQNGDFVTKMLFKN